jgi:hypothetical protein
MILLWSCQYRSGSGVCAGELSTLFASAIVCWTLEIAAACASRCRTAGCTTGACSPGHCKQLVLKRGWAACAKHPISHAEFVASGAG